MLEGIIFSNINLSIMKDVVVYTFILTVVFITTESRATIEYTEITQCLHSGQLLREGQSAINNCTNCTCIGGAVNCNQVECHKDPECILYETIPGVCCPECMEWGCYHKGVGYPRGARIPAPKCHYCFCPWKGGRKGAPVCTKVQCPPARCVDGTVPDGKCCPACPNGSNCWMSDILIPRGEEIWISPCRSCECQQAEANAGESGYAELKAKCSWRFEHKTCPYGK